MSIYNPYDLNDNEEGGDTESREKKAQDFAMGRELYRDSASQGGIAKAAEAGVGAGLMSKNPWVGAGVAGASLVSGLMEDRAQREKDAIANELIRRKNLADAYEMQGTSLSNALQRNQDVLARALL